MVEFVLNHCTGSVYVSSPFGNLSEFLDLDIGLGPHLEAFEIIPNFGLGKVIHPPFPSELNNMMQDHAVNHQLLDDQGLAPNLNQHDHFVNIGQDDVARTYMVEDEFMNDPWNGGSTYFWLNQNGLNSESFLCPSFEHASYANKGIIINEPSYPVNPGVKIKEAVMDNGKGKEKIIETFDLVKVLASSRSIVEPFINAEAGRSNAIKSMEVVILND